MDDGQIKVLVAAALLQLREKDKWLLEHNLSEQSISHKLAEYLQVYFTNNSYNVDCEYNGDVDNNAGKKRIYMLYNSLKQYGLLKANETQLETELIERAVFPDIIVHKRGSNADNLLVIEVKKANSTVPFQYDALKLIAYTSSNYGNHLKYQLGAFIVTDNQGGYEIDYYKDGQKIEEQ